MTRNQIDYFKAKEDKRHNLVSEAETQRSNLAQEAEQHRSHVANEQEAFRHNVSTEQLQAQSNVINQQHYERMDAETQRSNLARERETNRHNVVTEKQTAQSLAEQARHNRTSENLTYVHNAVTEGIERDRVTAYRGSIDVAQQQADTQDRLADVREREVAAQTTRSEYQNMYDAARTASVQKEYSYLDDQNTRGWIDSISNAVVRGSQAVKNVTDSIGNIMNMLPMPGSQE